MAAADISLNTDEAAAAVARWHQYADELVRHGASDPSLIEQLRLALGDIYADYVDAKAVELAERAKAYQRVADHARGHAERLANTARGFQEQDAANAAPLDNIAVD